MMAGRPTKFTAELGEQIAEYLKEGCPMGLTAGRVGIDRGTLTRWIRAGERDDAPEDLAAFCRKAKKARDDASWIVANSVKNHPDVRAQMWWLERTCEDFRKEQKIELSGSVEYRGKSLEELAVIAQGIVSEIEELSVEADDD